MQKSSWILTPSISVTEKMSLYLYNESQISCQLLSLKNFSSSKIKSLILWTHVSDIKWYLCGSGR